MSFRPPRPLAARWRPVDADGLEHLDLRIDGDAIVADSVVIGERGGRPYGVRYRLACDAGWTFRSLDLETTDGRQLSLRADGAGGWSDGDGAALPHLDGALDVDLAGSPFTNTLPIRRAPPGEGAPPVEFRMAYVPFDSFAPVIDGQRYQRLAGRLYRYEAADRSFAADLSVDDDGLVTDYPGLFSRLRTEGFLTP